MLQTWLIAPQSMLSALSEPLLRTIHLSLGLRPVNFPVVQQTEIFLIRNGMNFHQNPVHYFNALTCVNSECVAILGISNFTFTILNLMIEQLLKSKVVINGIWTSDPQSINSYLRTCIMTFDCFRNVVVITRTRLYIICCSSRFMFLVLCYGL